MVNLLYFVVNVKPLELKTNRLRAYSELKSTKHICIVCRLVAGGTAITTIMDAVVPTSTLCGNDLFPM